MVHIFQKGGKYFNTYFEVFGLGGPFILEGVQILRYYSEVHGPGGPNTSKYLDQGNHFGSIFFMTDPILHRGKGSGTCP